MECLDEHDFKASFPFSHCAPTIGISGYKPGDISVRSTLIKIVIIPLKVVTLNL